MSHPLLSRNPALQRLRDDGYFVQIVGDKFLVMRHVPYVNERRKVAYGTLVSPLELAGDVCRSPLEDHVILFEGEFPCDAQGVRMNLGTAGKRRELGATVFVHHSFSQKPPGGYVDYYQKMTTYHAMLAGPAGVLEPARSWDFCSQVARPTWGRALQPAKLDGVDPFL